MQFILSGIHYANSDCTRRTHEVFINIELTVSTRRGGDGRPNHPEKSLSSGGTLKFANVAARIKGSGKPGLKAALLTAHYDSVPNAPGAADDGSGTATLLETLRALKAGPLPKRDIIALFTDGEETGLIGSKVFVGQTRGGLGPGHPWMADVGLVLNIEAAGNRGPCCLFETSEQNGWLIREFARADPVAIGNSLSPASAWLLPGGSFGPLWPLVFRLASTVPAWRVRWPPGSILLIDLGALPAITIIGAGAYAMFASLDPTTIEVAVAVALFVPGAILPQLFRLFDLTSTSTRAT